MGSTKCVQGQAERSRGQQDPDPTSEALPQEILQSFGVQENQEEVHPCQGHSTLSSQHVLRVLS